MASNPTAHPQNKAAVPHARRMAMRRIVSRKITKDEAAFRAELVAGIRALVGMQIEDLYPPSDRDGEVRP